MTKGVLYCLSQRNHVLVEFTGEFYTFVYLRIHRWISKSTDEFTGEFQNLPVNSPVDCRNPQPESYQTLRGSNGRESVESVLRVIKTNQVGSRSKMGRSFRFWSQNYILRHIELKRAILRMLRKSCFLDFMVRFQNVKCAREITRLKNESYHLKV